MMRAGGRSASTITRLYCNPIKPQENGLRLMYSAVVCPQLQPLCPLLSPTCVLPHAERQSEAAAAITVKITGKK